MSAGARALLKILLVGVLIPLIPVPVLPAPREAPQIRPEQEPTAPLARLLSQVRADMVVAVAAVAAVVALASRAAQAATAATALRAAADE